MLPFIPKGKFNILLLLILALRFGQVSLAQCTITAACPGGAGANWVNAGTWTASGCIGGIPPPSTNSAYCQIIIIPACATIQVTNSVNANTYCADIYVYGTINFAVGAHLNLTANSNFYVIGPTGLVTGANAGDQITLGGVNMWTTAPASLGPGTSFGSTPLPIELLQFSATARGHVVDLDWATATEHNNDYFTIERSVDGIQFESIATVDGAGNSASLLTYSAIDNNPYSGTSYYRLKQTDYDGNNSYSSVEVVDINPPGDFSFQLYPNPADGNNVTMELNADVGAEVELTIQDVLGQIVSEQNLISDGVGSKLDPFEQSKSLGSGIYLISARCNGQLQQQKLIIR